VTNDRVLTSRHAGRRRNRWHGGCCNGHGDFRTGPAAARADAGAACRHRAAIVSFPAWRRRAQDVGWRLGEGGDGRGISGLASDRRGADVARTGRVARAALARQRGGMGLCHQRPMPGHHHQSARPVADRRLQCRLRLVFPARLRPFDPGHRHRGLLVRAGVRQRLFLRVWTFSISDWVGHIPPEVLGKYFGVPAATFANFPKREVYIAKGPVPPPLPAAPPPGSLDYGPLTHRYRLLAQRPEPYPGGTNRLVLQRQFPISTTITGALMQIKPGALREPHWHPNADEWQYYISGRARLSVFASHCR